MYEGEQLELEHCSGARSNGKFSQKNLRAIPSAPLHSSLCPKSVTSCLGAEEGEGR